MIINGICWKKGKIRCAALHRLYSLTVSRTYRREFISNCRRYSLWRFEVLRNDVLVAQSEHVYDDWHNAAGAAVAAMRATERKEEP